MDADENGKVKISELGPIADMMVRAIEGVESKEELMKSFDKNGDGALNKEEWTETATAWAKANQSKMAFLGQRHVESVQKEKATNELDL